eukprot:5872_1
MIWRLDRCEGSKSHYPITVIICIGLWLIWHRIVLIFVRVSAIFLPDSSRILLLILHAKQTAEIKETLAVGLEQIKYENDDEMMIWDNTMTQFRNNAKEAVAEQLGDPKYSYSEYITLSKVW